MTVKFFGLIPRRPDLTSGEFHDHYRHPHGTMGLNLTVTRGYVQSHQIHTDRLGPTQTKFEAVAELWVDNETDAVGLRQEPIVEKYIIPDEPKFVDMERLELLLAEEEVLRSGPTADMGLEEGDDMWSLSRRPLSIKLLHFVAPDGNSDWVGADDAALGKQLGAFRHVRCRALPSFRGTRPGYLGAHELWWPTRLAFDRGVEKAPAAFATLLARAGSSVTLLAQAERFY